MNSKVAILVNSCDLYESAWDPFFRLLNIQWSDCPYKIYLNTEYKDYNCDFLDVNTIKTGDEKTWTERVKKVLEEIDSEYILFMLEDFFLLEKVDQEKLDIVIAKMKSEKNVGFVFFSPRGIKYDLDYESGEVFSDNNIYCDSRVNACVGLWRKEFMLKMLYWQGNPWEFEHNATRLSWLLKERCCITNPEYASIFAYSFIPSEGYGITQRKWLPKNKELFSKFNIDVDFDALGIEENKSQQVDATKLLKKSGKDKVLFAIRRRIRKYKKRFKKRIRYLGDLILVKPKFSRYCKSIDVSN